MDVDARREDESALDLDAQDTLSPFCSPWWCRTGPAILECTALLVQAVCASGTTSLPCIAIKFAALVYAKDKIHLLAGAIGLIEDAFVVPLSCPQALLDTEIQVELCAQRQVS